MTGLSANTITWMGKSTKNEARNAFFLVGLAILKERGRKYSKRMENRLEYISVNISKI